MFYREKLTLSRIEMIANLNIQKRILLRIIHSASSRIDL